jgi:hypothetical protein
MIKRHDYFRSLEEQEKYQDEASSYIALAGVRTPPVDPIICCKDDTEISIGPLSCNGECDGLIIYKQGKFYVYYDPDTAKWRFTLAHELGHYLIEAHYRVLKSEDSYYACHTEFVANVQMEREADWFASGLLMPNNLFINHLPQPCFKDISTVADIFQVSLMSATLRTLQLTDVRSAMVIYRNNDFSWYYPSPELRLSGTMLPKKRPSAKSGTYRIMRDGFNGGPPVIQGASLYTSDWFDIVSSDERMFEEIFVMSAYNTILVLLTIECD